MPVDLPGFYWDEQKNRYFPVSSRPQTIEILRTTGPVPSRLKESANELSSEEETPPNRLKRKRVNPRSVLPRHHDLSYRHWSRTQHDMHCAQIEATSRAESSRTSAFGTITTFCSTSLLGEKRQFMGDSRGWLYSNADPDDPHQSSWMSLLNLHSGSEVSSISISGQHMVATAFGPLAKLAVQDLNVMSRTTLYSLSKLHDIWTCNLQEKSLLLGAGKKAAFFPDIQVSMSYSTLETFSDVFALERKSNMIYTGTRNGTIRLFDIREDKPSGQGLFNDRSSPSEDRTSVLYLRLVHEYQLLVSRMNGGLCMYDIRFPRSSCPTMVFHGHVNHLTQRLGIAVDPTNDFVFAVGDDNRIRGWSLHTGQSIQYSTDQRRPSSERKRQLSPFTSVFPGVVTALEVSEDADGGMSLWAAVHHDLYQYHLGQRAT